MGHSSGWGSAAWSNAIIVVDQQVGRVLNSLAAHAVYSNDTILIVTADHGGVLTGHSDASHYTNYTVPVFVWGPASRPPTFTHCWRTGPTREPTG